MILNKTLNWPESYFYLMADLNCIGQLLVVMIGTRPRISISAI